MRAVPALREYLPDPSLVLLRRQLHQCPELRFCEYRTAALLADRLGSTADQVTTGIAGTGLIASVTGDSPGPHVLLRADMDAYPVSDQKVAPYSSSVPGICHACGHDIHVTVVVGVIERFLADRPLRGTVTALFQPAEEIPFGERSGAQAVLESGELASRRFAAVLGLHCWPELNVGVIGLDKDIAMAAKDAFQIILTGRGAHAATPSRGRDAVLGMALLITSLHAAVARSHEANELSAFNVGTVAGGSTQSLVPDRAVCTGTLRTHDSSVRQRLRGVVETATRHVAEAFELQSTLTWANEMPAVRNHSALVALAREILPTVVDVKELPEPALTTDDFALLGSLAPSLYLKLGVRGQYGLGDEPLHSPRFDVDERCISVGIAALERLTRAILASDPEFPADLARDGFQDS